MFRLVTFCLVTSAFFAACSDRPAAVASELNINLNGPSSITCEGRVKFAPETGIANILNNDMEKLADQACGMPAKDTQIHSFVEGSSSDSSPPEKPLLLTSIKVDFSCDNGAVPEMAFAKDLPRLCSEALERFRAQQE